MFKVKRRELKTNKTFGARYREFANGSKMMQDGILSIHSKYRWPLRGHCCPGGSYSIVFPIHILFANLNYKNLEIRRHHFHFLPKSS